MGKVWQVHSLLSLANVIGFNVVVEAGRVGAPSGLEESMHDDEPTQRERSLQLSLMTVKVGSSKAFEAERRRLPGRRLV